MGVHAGNSSTSGARTLGKAWGGNTAVVLDGTIRVQALSPTLVRVEGVRSDANHGKKPFEDRPTFMCVNRTLGNQVGPAVTVTESEQYITVSTEYYAVRITKAAPPPPPPPPPNNESCTHLVGVGFTGFQRSPRYCNGTIVQDVGACCRACSEDSGCAGFMYSAKGFSESVDDDAAANPKHCAHYGNPPKTNCWSVFLCPPLPHAASVLFFF